MCLPATGLEWRQTLAAVMIFIELHASADTVSTIHDELLPNLGEPKSCVYIRSMYTANVISF